MVSFWDSLGKVTFLACLVPLFLYLEHGYVPWPTTQVFWVFYLRINSSSRWMIYWLFHWLFYIPLIISKLERKVHIRICGYGMYLRYCLYELRLFRNTHVELIIGIIILAFYIVLGLAVWSLWVQEGSLRGVLLASLSFCNKIIRFVPECLGIISPSSDIKEKYDVNNSYGDPGVLATGLVADLKHIGIKAGRKHLRTLLQVAMTKGEPVDDKLMTVSWLSVMGYQVNKRLDGEDDGYYRIAAAKFEIQEALDSNDCSHPLG
jgi:hypothetical protein